MNPSEENKIELNELQEFSRTDRVANDKVVQKEAKKKARRSTKVPGLHKFYLLILSLILSSLSVALPLFTDLANSVQSQNLYTGMMLLQGQIPFTDVFATGGFLYYVLIALSYYLGTSLFLIPVQFITFYISGIYFYKIIRYFADNVGVAATFSFVFYLMNLGLGFGGLYPIQFAMPFVLVSLWFLTKYFAGIIRDEAFILYGFAGATAMLLEPRTLVFWGLSFLTILVYNIKEKHAARGFYQLLCVIFGMILVFYTAGYYILNMQMLSPYLSQAVIYQFSYFNVGNGELWMTLAFQLLAIFASGLLLGVLAFIKMIKIAENKVVKWLILLVLLGHLAIALLSQDFQLYHLLPALPYGLILTSLLVNKRYQDSLEMTSHRRKSASDERSAVFKIFSNYHLYLPFVLLIFALGQPLVRLAFSTEVNAKRDKIATYLKKHTSEGEKIYVWDNTAKIYLQTELASSSKFPLPVVNTVKKTNAKKLEDELLQNSASYVVVNRSVALSSTLKNSLSTYYEDVSIDGISGFAVYQKK